MSRTKAFINEKDISTDWLDDLFEDDIHITSQDGKHHMEGLWNGHLLEITWYRKDNRINFHILDPHDIQDEQPLYDIIRNVDSHIEVDIERTPWGWIHTKWYFKDDC